jgi:hypothetical protein
VGRFFAANRAKLQEIGERLGVRHPVNFAGATVDASLTATITSTSSTTESIIGSYVGSLSIPEPSTVVLKALAVSVGAIVVVRGRRRKAMTR